MRWYAVTKWLLCMDTRREGTVYVAYKCRGHLQATFRGLYEIYKPRPDQSDYSIPRSCALNTCIHM